MHAAVVGLSDVANALLVDVALVAAPLVVHGLNPVLEFVLLMFALTLSAPLLPRHTAATPHSIGKVCTPDLIEGAGQ